MSHLIMSTSFNYSMMQRTVFPWQVVEIVPPDTTFNMKHWQIILMIMVVCTNWKKDS